MIALFDRDVNVVLLEERLNIGRKRTPYIIAFVWNIYPNASFVSCRNFTNTESTMQDVGLISYDSCNMMLSLFGRGRGITDSKN